MLLLGQRLPVLAEGVRLLRDVQLRRLPPARLVRKGLPPLKLLLQTVLVEPL